MKVLFLCTGNACRSQMAEGWARALHGARVEARSAGIRAHGVDPRAAQVMAEEGVDLGGHRSKTVDELGDERFDLVVTVCPDAEERRPALPGDPRVVHVAFDDPPALAREASDPTDALRHYRRVRDEIRAFVAALPMQAG